MSSKQLKVYGERSTETNYLTKEPIFIHIPKNAGTSIRNALGIRHYDADAHTTHVPWGEALMSEWYNAARGPYLFACLRHPCDRAVSIHRHFARRMRRVNGMNFFLEELCHQRNLNDFWCSSDIEQLQPYTPHLKSQYSFLKGAPYDILLKKDVDSIVQACERYVRDSDFTQWMVNAAYLPLIEKFKINHTVEKTADLYARVLLNSRGMRV